MAMMDVFTVEIDTENMVRRPMRRQLDNQNMLKGMYKYIKCDLVDCVSTEIDGHYYDIWCDDEGLLIDHPIPNIYLSDYQIICGNVLIAKSDEEGRTVGLDSSDFDRLLKWTEKNAEQLADYFKRRKH